MHMGWALQKGANLRPHPNFKVIFLELWSVTNKEMYSDLELIQSRWNFSFHP